MAKLVGKGTNLQVTISATLTTIAQLIDFSVGAQDPEVFECRTLDNSTAAVSKTATGYTSQGDITGTMFYDPANATHQFIAVNSQTPGTTVAGKVILTDGSSSELTFTAATIGMGDTAISMSDGVKTGLTIKTAGLVTYPES